MTKSQARILELETELRCAREELVRLDLLLRAALQQPQPLQVPQWAPAPNYQIVRGPDTIDRPARAPFDHTISWAADAKAAFAPPTVSAEQERVRIQGVVEALQSESGMVDFLASGPPEGAVFFGLSDDSAA